MHRQLAYLFFTMTFGFSSLFSSFAKASEGLSEVKKISDLAISIGADKSKSKKEKLAVFKSEKAKAEAGLKKAIQNGKADAKNLKQDDSELSRAFKSVDYLTALAELKLDQKGNYTEVSCESAKGLISSANYVLGSEKLETSQDDKKILNLIESLCHP